MQSAGTGIQAQGEERVFIVLIWFARLSRVMVACATDMPGVRPQMIDWWFGWHVSDHQRYKLWHPRAHTRTRPKKSRQLFPGFRGALYIYMRKAESAGLP